MIKQKNLFASIVVFCICILLIHPGFATDINVSNVTNSSTVLNVMPVNTTSELTENTTSVPTTIMTVDITQPANQMEITETSPVPTTSVSVTTQPVTQSTNDNETITVPSSTIVSPTATIATETPVTPDITANETLTVSPTEPAMVPVTTVTSTTLTQNTSNWTTAVTTATLNQSTEMVITGQNAIYSSLATTSAQAFVEPATTLGPGAVPDIVALKSNLTKNEIKLSTALLLESGTSSNVTSQIQQEITSGLIIKTVTGTTSTALTSAGTKNTSGKLVYVYVYVQPGYSTHIVDSLAAEVTDRDEANHLAVTWVDTQNLSALAALEGVKNIQEVIPPLVNIGSVTTQGDIIHKTANVRSTYGYSGAGMKIGIISDGVDHLSSAVASGDLPSTVHVLSNTQGGDEGTAMLEIVHDMVPDATLYFHDMGSNTVAFNSAIDDLRSNGCTVICDDVGWITDPFFEDGTVASHVNSVLSSNQVIYVSSAGNAAQKHYQGTFYDRGSGYNDFSQGTDPTYKALYVNLPAGSSVRVVLEWNDQFGHSGNDYDLYLSQSTYGDLGYSTNTQSGSGNPLEWIAYSNTGSSTITGQIDVRKLSGVAKTLELYVYPSSGASVYTNNIVPADSIFGQPAVPDVIAAAAVYQGTPSTIESYSSRGPVTISYPSATSRSKPDISGVDGVSITGAGGFSSPFYGTSAAAPHIAAVVAQIWGAHPSLTPAQVRNALYNSAVDLGTAGKDTTFGYGRADALGMEGMVGGADKIGVFRPTTHSFYLDYNGNGVWSGAAIDRQYNFGLTGDLPVSGDWNNDGKSEFGVYRPTTHSFYLDYNGNGVWSGATIDRQYNFGLTGDLPVSGDWNNDGKSEFGVFRPSTHSFYLDYNGNGVWNGATIDRQYNFGLTGDLPVSGDWNNDGKSDFGVFRPSTHSFYLDYNGNGVWNGASIDRSYNLGLIEDQPVSGVWS
ncbi:MAG: S8 family serine peptidase [Methanoregula sp.]|jgi:hypothetical protein